MPVSAERQRQLRAQKKQLKTKTCARCGKQFQPVRKDQKYCSAACRQPERIEPENKAKKLRALSKERLALAVEGQKIRQRTARYQLAMDAVSRIADVQKAQIKRRKLLKAWGPCGTAQSPADFIAQFNEAAERIATEYGPNFFTPRLVLEGDGIRLRHRGGKCSIGHCMNVLDQLEAITSDPNYALMSDFIFAAMAQVHQKKLTNPDGLYFRYLVYERA